MRQTKPEQKNKKAKLLSTKTSDKMLWAMNKKGQPKIPTTTIYWNVNAWSAVPNALLFSFHQFNILTYKFSLFWEKFLRYTWGSFTMDTLCFYVFLTISNRFARKKIFHIRGTGHRKFSMWSCASKINEDHLWDSLNNIRS